KAMNIDHWVDSENAAFNDWTYYLRLLMQDHCDPSEVTAVNLMKSFVKHCQTKDKFVEPAVELISNEVNKVYKEEPLGAFFYAYNACQLLSEANFSLKEISEIWLKLAGTLKLPCKGNYNYAPL